MRISTGMIFDSGVSSMNNLSASIMQVNQQLASGKSINSPADNPVAAAQALDVTQASDINAQYAVNQNNASSALGLAGSQLSSVTDLLTQAQQLAVQAGNATLNSSDRATIATQLTSIFNQMVGLANSQNSSGQYIFSGNKGNTQPFSGTVTTGITYNGDNGQQMLQLSSSQQLAVSDSGNNIFQNIPAGNGYFATANAAGNSGSGVIDGGSVSDPVKWNASNQVNLQVKFEVISGATFYDLVNATTGNSLFTGTASTSNGGGAGDTFTHAYTAGQPIPLSGTGFNFGASVTITGAPTNGDAFNISPGQKQSVFTTLANLITSLTTVSTSTPAGSAQLTNAVSSALTNISNANNNVLTVSSAIGSRQNEVTSLAGVNSSISLQYQQTLSNLQDVNYTQAVSNLTQLQTQLTAAQKSFAMVSQMSLFTFLP